MTPDQEKALRAELEEAQRALRDISVRASTIECGAHNGRLNADCTTCRDIAFIQSLTAGGDKSEEWTLRHENRSLRTALAAAQGVIDAAVAYRKAYVGSGPLDYGKVQLAERMLIYAARRASALAALNTSGKPGGEVVLGARRPLEPEEVVPAYSAAEAGERDVLKPQIEHMVRRFLTWKLPADFAPDAGISFKATFNENTPFPARHEPIGTNLFTATQAKAMVRHMIEGMPAGEAGKPGGEAQAGERERALEEALVRLLETQSVSFSDEQAAAIDHACDNVLHRRVETKESNAWRAPAPPEGHPAPACRDCGSIGIGVYPGMCDRCGGNGSAPGAGEQRKGEE